MGKGELVCFSLENNPIRLKSMNAQRHPQLRTRIGITPPDHAKAPPLALPAPATPPKSPPLQPWHFDPKLFRKWPQIPTESRVEGEPLQEQTEVKEVSLGL
jgi:hypothetical protein